MRRLFRSVTTLSVVLLASSAAAIVTACSSSSDTVSPQTQLAGMYSLRTVNGQTPPVDLGRDSASGSTYAIISDVYTFNSDGSFTEHYVIRETPPTGLSNTQPLDDSGRWVLNGTTVTATFVDQSYLRGTFTNGNTITFSNGSVSAVYQK